MGSTIVTINVTNVAPNVTITVPMDVQFVPFMVTITFNESVSDFTARDITLGGESATVTNVTGRDRIYTATITPDTTADGDVTIRVPAGVAQDAAGDGNTASDTHTVHVEPDETIWMPDANLRREVRNRLGLANNVLLTQTAMQELDELFAGVKGITDLTGLEYATEVFRLELYDNSIRDLTSLAGLPSLVSLHLSNNDIRDLTPFSGKGFWILSLWDNPFLELPAAEITVPTGVQTGAFDVTISFGQSVTDFEQSDLSISGPANATITSWDANITGDRYTARITPAADGDVVLNVAAGAADGTRRAVLRQSFQNGLFLKLHIKPPVGDADPTDATLTDLQEPNIAAVQKTVSVNLPDETGPSVEITGVPTTTQTGAFTVTITFSESVTGFVAGDITLTGATATGTLTGSGTTYTVTITPTSTGTLTIQVPADVAQDTAGNDNTASQTHTVQVDPTQPTVSISVPSGEQTGEFMVTVEFSEAVNGFVQNELTFTTTGTAGATITNWTGQDGDTAYTATVLPSGTGNLVFNVAANVATDTAGNQNEAATAKTVQVNPISPIPTITVPSDVQMGAFMVTITFSEPVTGFTKEDITLVGDADATVSDFTENGNTYTATITPTISGILTIRVKREVAQDNEGNYNTAALQQKVEIDLIKPSVEITVPTSVQTGEFMVTVEFSEAVNGFVQDELTFTTTGTAGATITNWTGQDGDTTYTATILPSGTGNLVFNVAANVAQDTAGNSNTAATQQTVVVNIPADTTRPTVSISVPSGVQNGAFSVTITFSESVTGFATIDITLTGATATATLTGSGTTYTATITPTTQGNLTIQVPDGVAQDEAGNRNVASEAYTVPVNPTAPGDPIAEDGPEPLIIVERDGTKYATGTPPFAGTETDPVVFYVIIKFDEAVTGFVLDDLILGAPEDLGVPEAKRRVSITEWSGQDDNPDYTAKNYTAKVKVTKTAFVGIWVPANVAQAADNDAWNVQSAKQTVAVWIDGAAEDEDIVPPSARIEVLRGPGVTIVVSSGGRTDIIEEIRVTGIFKIEVVFSEPVSGFIQTDLKVSVAGNTSANITDWVANPDGVRYTVTITPTEQGNLRIRVPSGVAQDAAGNWNVPTVTFIKVDFPDQADTTPPTVTLETPDTAQGTFEVTITFSEAVIGFTQSDLSLSGTASATITSWTTSGNSTYTATLSPNADGEVTLNVPANVARDLADNGNTPAEAKTVTISNYNSRPTPSIRPPTGAQRAPFEVIVEFSAAVTGFVQDELLRTGTAGTTISNWVVDSGGAHYTATLTPTHSGTLILTVESDVAMAGTAGNRPAAPVTVLIWPEDVDRDGDVDIFDLFKVALKFGQTIVGDPEEGNPDVNRDGEVDIMDFNMVEGRIGTNIGGAGAATPSSTRLTALRQDIQALGSSSAVPQDVIQTLEKHVTALAPADTSPPGASISMPSGVQNGAFDATITFTEVVSSFEQTDLSLTGTANTTITAWTTTDNTTYIATLTPTTSGSVTLRVPAGVATDAANNNNTASNTQTVSADVDRPSVSLSVPSGVQTGVFSVTITFSEVVSGFVQSNLSLSGTASATITSWTASSNTAYTATLTPTTSGSVTVSVPANAATDAANNNNTTSNTQTVSVDVDPPGVSVSVPSGVQTGAFSVTITFTEPVSGFAQSDVSLSGTASATITSWTASSNTAYTATITPTTSGSVTVSVPANVATDAAKNKNTVSNTKTVIINVPPPIPDPATWMPDANLRTAVREDLGLADNETLTQAKMLDLTSLHAPQAGISNLTGLEHATNLTSLVLWQNQISSLTPIQNLTKLTEIRMGSNQISSVTPLGGLTKLTRLGLQRNNISNISALSSLVNLQWLWLVGNSITDFSPLSSLSNLTDVDVEIPPPPDTEAPGVSISVPSGVQTDAFDVSVTFTESVSGFTQSELSLTGTASASVTAWSTTDNTTYTATITPTLSGSVTLNVNAGVATDAANNPNTAATSQTVTVSVDTESPSVSISVPSGVQNGAFNVSITFTEAVSGFTQSDLSVGGTASASVTAWSANSDNTIYTATITPTLSGSVTVSVPANVATDAANNKNTVSNTKMVKVDVDRPGVSVSVPSGVQSSAFSVTITFTEPVSGFVQADVSLTTNTAGATITSWSASEDKTTYTATITPTLSGSVTLSVPADVVTDAAKNKNTASNTKTITINVPPPIPDPATWMPDANLRTAVGASLNLSQGETLTQAKMRNLTELKAAGRSISNITGIKYATNLTTARFAKNQISDISPLANLTQLTTLRLQNNQVSSISSLSRLTNLTELFLDNNQIRDVTPLASLVNLTTLRLAGNPFETAGANTEALDTLRAAGVNIDIPAVADAPAGEWGAYPHEMLLLPNYPNPFNPETWIPYHLSQDSDVDLTIYDVRGVVVRRLALGHQEVGYYTNRSRAARWDGKNNFGDPVGNGVYLFTLTAGDFSATRKMLMIK